MNPFEIGDPYIEWNEENAAQEFNNDFNEIVEERLEEKRMSDVAIKRLEDAVIKLLVSNHDFDLDEAEEKVETSVVENEDMWNENAVPEDLAKYLASEESDE